MKRLTIVSLLLTIAVALYAQEPKQYPEPGKMTHDMTEFWLPQPPIVTPGDNAKCTAPSHAIVLFDGTNLDAWKSAKTGGEAEWNVHDGVVTVDKKKGDIITKEAFGSFQMHIEWCVPEDIEGSSQGRGNSGVYLQDMYEIQVLDTYKNETYANGATGSIYKQVIPLANAMLPPGQWNVYDIIYNAPVFNADGTYKVHPTVTLLHNGVLLLNNFAIQGTTEDIGLPKVKAHGDGPIRLQSHGDKSQPISFRNIWLRKL